MISLSFRLENPWSKGGFKNFYSAAGDISKHKAWEFEVCHYPRNVVEFIFSFSFRGTDHAGLRLELGILGYSATLTIYDTRHWDDETDNWETYDDTCSTTQD